MQYKPTAETLLLALGDFLQTDVRPAIEDRGLSFRVLIAANLARIVAMELACEEGHDASELAGLAAVLDEPTDDPVARSGRRAAIDKLSRRLAEKIAGGEGDEAWLSSVQEQVTRTLRDRLTVSNPRFDTSPHIEGAS